MELHQERQSALLSCQYQFTVQSMRWLAEHSGHSMDDFPIPEFPPEAVADPDDDTQDGDADDADADADAAPDDLS